MKPELVIRGALLSEKAAGFVDKQIYGLKVDLKATKSDIRQALKEVFDVDVVAIRTLVLRGDESRRVRSKGSASFVDVKKPNIKKAYIKLKAGQTLPVPTLGTASGGDVGEGQ